MTILALGAIYFEVGLLFLSYLIAEDIKNGRGVQKRDLWVLLAWPMFLFICLLVGMAVFSDMTSKDKDGRDLLEDILGGVRK